jgi:hypothetical protein
MKITLAGVSIFLFFSALLIATTPAAQKASNPILQGDQATAVGCLRSINTAEVFYAKEYKKGFSPTLASLGPPPEGAKPSASAAGLLDNSLTGGKKSNYVFTYKAGRPNASWRITTYSVVARPAQWQKGLWTFFTDQTGIIRGTDENRAARVSDPPLQ